MTDAGAYAAAAMRAYATMQARFRRRDGGYRRDGLLGRVGATAHLWPFIRAFVATLDLAGVAPELVPGFDAVAELADRRATLERYWDPAPVPGAYASDVVSSRFGGDRYYDDNAWVGLALIEFERLRPGAGQLPRVGELLRFVAGGWDDRRDVPSPGGVFWVQQNRGAGRRNHDRNTVSNAPNAQLAWHLAELTGGEPAAMGSIGPRDLYDWVNGALDAAPADGAEPGTGLFWDKWRGDGSLDTTQWSYNQGSMVGANVLLARRTAGPGGSRFLARAEAIGRRALAHYAGAGLTAQPRAFNAILFRNLLLLHHATADDVLRAAIMAAMRGYADRPDFSAGAATLLDHSGVVQILALLAWDPCDYGKLA